MTTLLLALSLLAGSAPAQDGGSALGQLSYAADSGDAGDAFDGGGTRSAGYGFPVSSSMNSPVGPAASVSSSYSSSSSSSGLKDTVMGVGAAGVATGAILQGIGWIGGIASLTTVALPVLIGGAAVLFLGFLL